MTVAVSLPARINVVGSPTDAVEGAYATISCAVPVRGGARLRRESEWIFARDGDPVTVREPLRPIHFERRPDGFDLVRAAVSALARHSPEFAAKATARGAAITTWTRVPRSSGLAGSSVLVLSVLAGLRELFELAPRPHNDYVLAEIAQRAEEGELGIICGFADRYVPLFGGIAYLSYHGKLHHRPLGEEPYVTYERLTTLVPPLTWVVATTGVVRDSGDIHKPMRERYLQEQRTGEGPLLPLARALGETAWRGKIALLAGDLEEVGRQIDENHRLVDNMMRSCGYAEGAGAEVNRLVNAAKSAGALGAKLTGAGGGGAVFALPGRHREEEVASALSAAGAAGVWRLPVEVDGLRVERS